MNNNNKRSNKNRNNRGKRSRARPRPKKNVKLVVSKPGLGLPYHTKAFLVWRDLTTARTRGSADAMNFSVQSSAYDPDPAYATGAIPHFVELANEFNAYRVFSMKVDWEFINNNDNPVTCCIWPTPFPISANSLSYSQIIEYSANAGGRSFTVGRFDGQPRGRLRGVTHGRTWFGPNFHGDHIYSSSTSSSPSSMYYWNFGIFTPTQANFNNQVCSNLTVTYEIQFFEKNVVLT